MRQKEILIGLESQRQGSLMSSLSFQELSVDTAAIAKPT